MRYQIKDKHNFFIREDGDSSMVLFKEKHDQFYSEWDRFGYV